MRRGMCIIMVTLALAGCTTTGSPISSRADTTPVPANTRIGPGPGNVIGRDAAALIAWFDQPNADVREGTARKLQFAGTTCILDAYLYAKGNAAPVVTYVDSRQPDGRPADRASCISALSGRGGK